MSGYFLITCILKSRYLLIFCFLFNILEAQQLTTHLYNVNDGLPTSSVFSAYEDHLGYLWIGTPNGLSRFDGRQFVNYGLADGLPSSVVDRVFEDSRHRFWACTRKGMARLMGNRFFVYPVGDNQDINFVFGIKETRSEEVWALTNKGVYRFEDNLWQKVPLYPGSENSHSRQMLETDSGLYINYGDRIVFRNKENKWRLVAENHSKEVTFFNQMQEHDGQIFVSTRKTICRLDDSGLKPFLDNLKVSNHLIYFFDSKNCLWYYSQEGDSYFHVSMPGKWRQISWLLPNHYGIISIITEDSHGTIWVGTQKGLLKITERAITTVVGGKHDESKGGITAVPIPDSNLMVLLNDGLFKYYFDKKSEAYATRKLIKKNISGPIDCYAKDDKGGVWFITRSGKMYRFKNDKLDDMNHLLHLSTSETFFSCTYDKRKQRLFFCGDSTVFVGDNKRINVFIPTNIKMPLPPGSSVLTTKKGQVLVHVTGKGIYLIDEKDNLLLLWPGKDKNIYAPVYEDADNNIWVVDDITGLRQFHFDINGKLELINTISKKDGLQDNIISSITSDALNRIWVSTSAGLDILQKDRGGKWKVFNYSKSAGLNLNDWPARAFTDARGNVWINSFFKLTRFDAGNIHLKNEIPKVSIENVQVNLRDVDWRHYTDSFSGYREFPLNPKLKFADNTISIHYNGISFSTAPRLEYSYQLLPLNTLWSMPTATTSVSFVKLPPGYYTFKVKTRNQASDWSEPALFSFSITKPFWMHWWFITLCVLAIVFVIYTIFKYRLNQLRKLLAIRTKISRDLHDEVGSTLSSINILSKVSQSNLEKDKGKTSVLLQKITEQSEKIQQSMSDIVWSIRPDNDKLQNLVTRMREYLGQTAEPKNMQVEFSTDEKILNETITMERRQQVFLIFKEAVNNAVKYSQANKLSVFLEKEDHQIKLSVSDDGLGFDTEKISSSNGLKNMRERAKELKGTLHIQSSPGNGAIVELKCPTT